MDTPSQARPRFRPARRDLLCGALISGFGLAAFLLAQSYRMGSLTSMGPGYFPWLLGLLLILLGGLVMLLEPMGRAIPQLPLRALSAISAGVLAFAACIDSLGLVAAVVSSMLLSSLAITESRLIPALVTAGLMAIAAVLVFDLGLGLQLRAFG